ncbi:MAG: flagellar basal body-associated FliL family protein [Deltaproteobacteria bacterium]|nr:flagellar basal body-associated FliL family protein [Deltaproteobacteria bacterium]
MAEDERKIMAEEEPASQSGSGGGFLKIIIIVVVVVVVLGGVGFAVLTFGTDLFSSSDKATGEQTASGESADASKTAEPLGVLYPMKPFIVNLAEAAGKRYLKITFDLELTNKEVQGEINSRMAPIQDSLLILLSSKSFSDISTVEGKMRLRMEIIGRINNFLVQGRVKNAYFTEFVVQ